MQAFQPHFLHSLCMQISRLLSISVLLIISDSMLNLVLTKCGNSSVYHWLYGSARQHRHITAVKFDHGEKPLSLLLVQAVKFAMAAARKTLSFEWKDINFIVQKKTIFFSAYRYWCFFFFIMYCKKTLIFPSYVHEQKKKCIIHQWHSTPEGHISFYFYLTVYVIIRVECNILLIYSPIEIVLPFS